MNQSKIELFDKSNNESSSPSINELPCSPALFEASEVPSCTTSFELSPPIAASKRKKRSLPEFTEHSLGVSMFDSSPLKGEETLNCESSPNVVSSKGSQAKHNAIINCRSQIDCNDDDDDFFMSPPITSNIKRNNFNMPKKITQSTPIVGTKQPTHQNRNLFSSPPTAAVHGNKETNLSLEIKNKKSEQSIEHQLNDYDLSPTIFKVTRDKTVQFESSLENSNFDIDNFPLKFEVESVEKTRLFNYPARKKTSATCLDSISIIKEETPIKNNVAVTKKHENTSITIESENSSMIDMDLLTQLPFHSIDIPVPFKVTDWKDTNIFNDNLKTVEEKIELDDMATHNNKVTTPFTGFQTAKGNSVQISEKALKAAREKFESDDTANNNSEVTTPFAGFQTAKGNSVQISEKALKAAREKIKLDDTANNISKVTTPFTVFQTDKGNSVQISGKALKAAREKFESDDTANPNSKVTTTFEGFQTAKGNSVKISENALKAAREKIESDDTTSSTSTMTTSFKALKAAKEKIESDDTRSNNSRVTSTFNNFQTSSPSFNSSISSMSSSKKGNFLQLKMFFFIYFFDN